MIIDPREPNREPAPVPSRRDADQTLPFLYRFLLSLVVLVGSFVYLFVAKPDTVIVAAVLGFNGAVITYWFVKTGGNPPSDRPSVGAGPR